MAISKKETKKYPLLPKNNEFNQKEWLEHKQKISLDKDNWHINSTKGIVQGVWSDTKDNVILLGNPFVKKTYIKPYPQPEEILHLAIQCVKPLYTIDDMKDLEEIP